MDNEIRKILAEFVAFDDGKYPGKVFIKYKQPNSKDPAKIWNHSAIEAKLSDSAVEKYATASAGERFTVHQTRDDKGYPLIVDITDAKDAPPKYVAKTGGFGGTGGAGKFTPRDDTGMQVGNALNVAAITLGAGASLEEIKDRAIGILHIGEELKEYLKGIKPGDAPVFKKEAEEPAKQLTRAEQIKMSKNKPVMKEAEQDYMEQEQMNMANSGLEDDDLDTVEF